MKIVLDADYLEALGAIGIARTFVYAGAKYHKLYDPTETAVAHRTFEEYKKRQSSAITHFYEKIVHLHSRLQTPTAKAIGKERHNFLVAYLDKFSDEISFAEKCSAEIGIPSPD